MSEFVIQFDDSLGVWSPFVYWFVLINTLLCAGFTVAVVVGGIFDLRFLFKALREEEINENDDGRVEDPPKTKE
jgi:hypothetical protein